MEQPRSAYFSHENASVDDWQGRLPSVIEGVFPRDDLSLQAGFRLLASREAIELCEGKLNPTQILEVVDEMGPKMCLLTELHNRGATFIYPRSLDEATTYFHCVENTLSWTSVLPWPRRLISFSLRP